MNYHIINTCDVTLWGISQQQRIQKVLNRIDDFKLCADVANILDSEKILLLRADYLYEANVIKKLLELNNSVLMSSSNENKPVAAWVEAKHIQKVIEMLKTGELIKFSKKSLA